MTNPTCVTCVQISKQISVPEAQVRRGFAFVSEAACEQFLLLKKKTVPADEGDEEDRKTELALACIAAIKPELTDVEAASLINLAFVLEHADCYEDSYVDPDAMSEVLNAGESKKVHEDAVRTNVVKSKQLLVLHTKDTTIHKYFKKSPPVKYSAAEKKIQMGCQKRRKLREGYCLDSSPQAWRCPCVV